MKLHIQAFSAVIAGVVTLALAVPAAHAQLNKEQQKCQATIAKETGKYVKARFKEKAKCADKNLKTTGSCDFGKRDDKLLKAETKLRSGLQKKCGDAFLPGFDDESLAAIGFPGKCVDTVAPSDEFGVGDLKNCMFTTHKDLVDALFDLQYGLNGADGVTDFETRAGALIAKDLGKCQKEIGKNGLKLVLTIQKEISKCRNKILKNEAKVPPVPAGFSPVDCGDNTVEPKPQEKIAKTRSKLIAKITDKCPDPLLVDPLIMDVCDTGSGPETTVAGAAPCIADTHENASDDPANDGSGSPFGLDLIDLEYALAAVCGDGIVNEPALPAALSANSFVGFPAEECDGADDSACPGECGGPFEVPYFPCLCKGNLASVSGAAGRHRVDEQDPADLDNGWSGTSHDSTVVQDSGYWSELYDCDGPGGPDTLCTVGPSCTIPFLGTHFKCFKDSDCFFGTGPCRKSSLTLAPHCHEDNTVACTTNAQCTGSAQDFCRRIPHGIPLPLSSGGVSVCIVNIFSEDVVGTTDLADGSSEVRLRQDSVTHLNGGGAGRNHPCPTCGGYCSAASAANRTLCQVDSDCAAGLTCITSLTCSAGDRINQPCRADPPYGNSTALFGNPSIDCPPLAGADISGGGLDILFNPSTTGTNTTRPSLNCLTFGFTDKKCIFGTDTGKTCLVDTDCAGSAEVGRCTGQCPCPVTGGTPAQPNACDNACRGGTNDYGLCPGGDSDCPGGFCQTSSCREANGVCRDGTNIGGPCLVDSECPGGTCGDDDSSNEGFCPTGPGNGRCSTSDFVPCLGVDDCRHACEGGSNPGTACSAESDCLGGGTCTEGCDECLKDNTETCITTNRDCQPNEGYTRSGLAGVPTRTTAANYCIPSAGAPAVDNVAGLPGPGALSQDEIITLVGF